MRATGRSMSRRTLPVTAFMNVLLVMFGASCSSSSPVAPSASAPTVHDTLNPPGGASNADGATSERSGAFDRQTYDDFVSPAATRVRMIGWQGIRAVAQPVTSFFVAFVADNSGFPRLEPDAGNTGRPRALYIATFPVAQLNERLDVTQACTNSPLQQCGLYDYSVTLTTPFDVAAGTRYWLLIQAETPATASAAWAWRRGTADNQRAGTNIAGTIHLFDLAFSLR